MLIFKNDIGFRMVLDAIDSINDTEFAKCRVVHLLTGKASWVKTVVRQVSFSLVIVRSTDG